MTPKNRLGDLSGEHLPDLLRVVAIKYSLETEQYVYTRCLECNEPLRRAGRAEAANPVPPKVLERETDF